MPFDRKKYMKEYWNKKKNNLKFMQKRNKQRKEHYQKNKTEILQKQKQERELNPEINKRGCKKYYQNHKEKFNENSKIYRKKNPEKIRARTYANRQLKYLKKPGYEFHHPDYSKPLMVEVLPIKEHRLLHVQINQMRDAKMVAF